MDLRQPPRRIDAAQIHENHGCLVVIRCLVIQSRNGARQNCTWFGIPRARRKQGNTKNQNQKQKTEKSSSYRHSGAMLASNSSKINSESFGFVIKSSSLDT